MASKPRSSQIFWALLLSLAAQCSSGLSVIDKFYLEAIKDALDGFLSTPRITLTEASIMVHTREHASANIHTRACMHVHKQTHALTYSLLGSHVHSLNAQTHPLTYSLMGSHVHLPHFDTHIGALRRPGEKRFHSSQAAATSTLG